MSDDLAAIQPLRQSITVAGQAVTVRAVPLRYLNEVKQALQGLLAAVQASRELTASDLAGLVADQTEGLALICAHCSGLSQSAILDLAVDEALPLVEAVLKVNADFFLRQLPTRIVGLVTALAGSPPSSDSSVMATTTPLSSTTP
jgi:hypothetical protein